jgi:hypothetical protein
MAVKAFQDFDEAKNDTLLAQFKRPAAQMIIADCFKITPLQGKGDKILKFYSTVMLTTPPKVQAYMYCQSPEFSEMYSVHQATYCMMMLQWVSRLAEKKSAGDRERSWASFAGLE